MKKPAQPLNENLRDIRLGLEGKLPPTENVPAASARGRKRAVIYVRVSSARQVNRSRTNEDGFSLPAQLDACERKAASLGAAVIERYI